MNTDSTAENTSRYEKLAKPKSRIDRVSNFNAFKVKRGALSYEITDSLNKLAQPKRKPGANYLQVQSSSLKNVQPEKQGYRKLINNNELSKESHESQKKKFNLDTYARITAARSRRCSNRLHELARPKNYSTSQAEGYEDFDNYFQTIKRYDPKSGSVLASQKKR